MYRKPSTPSATPRPTTRLSPIYWPGTIPPRKEILAKVAAPDATTSYLKAIVAARTNNESGVLSNLRDAAAKADSAPPCTRKSDLEFANFNLSNL